MSLRIVQMLTLHVLLLTHKPIEGRGSIWWRIQSRSAIVVEHVRRVHSDPNSGEGFTVPARPTSICAANKQQKNTLSWARYQVSSRAADAGALAESLIGLYKTECVKPDGPWRSTDDLELATLNWVWWFNSIRLHSSIGDAPPIGLRLTITMNAVRWIVWFPE